jgi:hypothetical protein
VLQTVTFDADDNLPRLHHAKTKIGGPLHNSGADVYCRAMSYLTFRVEITRDEWRADAPAQIEITAYIDRVPETDSPTRGMLARASKGVWNSRLQFTGDFNELSEALGAIDAAYPDAARIRCYEYTVDDEFPREAEPLVKSGGTWEPEGDERP